MENRLRQLFDFQKFEGNASLQQVIDDVHARYAVRELDMDDMAWVNAAGSSSDPEKKRRKLEEGKE